MKSKKLMKPKEGPRDAESKTNGYELKGNNGEIIIL